MCVTKSFGRPALAATLLLSSDILIVLPVKLVCIHSARYYYPSSINGLLPFFTLPFLLPKIAHYSRLRTQGWPIYPLSMMPYSFYLFIKNLHPSLLSFSYHIKYMFVGYEPKLQVETVIKSLRPALQLRLRFIISHHSVGGEGHGHQTPGDATAQTPTNWDIALILNWWGLSLSELGWLTEDD